MTMISEGIKDILVAASVGLFNSSTPLTISQWGIFIGLQPDENHDRVITIYDSHGATANPRWLLDYPVVQVVVRGDQNGYVETYNKAIAIKNALVGIDSHDRNGDRWDGVYIMGDVGFMGYDKNKRPEFTMNFNLIVEPAVSAGEHREPL